MANSPSMPAQSQANLDSNIAYRLTVPIAIWVALSFLCVLGRLWSRRIKQVGLGHDDWLVITAETFGIALATCALLLASYGVGRHTAYVEKYHPENLETIGKINFALEISYVFTMFFAKLSVVALYQRIVTVPPRWFTIACWTVIVYLTLWTLGVFLAVLLECQPISALWKSDCAPVNSNTTSTGVLNIVDDFVLVLLPQPIIWSLRLPLHRRLGVSCLLCLGLFATAISIARIPIITGGKISDITRWEVLIQVLTVLEPLTVIICACLPAMQACAIPLRSYLDSIAGKSGALHSLRSLVSRGIRGSSTHTSETDATSDVERTWVSLESREGQGNETNVHATHDNGDYGIGKIIRMEEYRIDRE